MTHLWQSAPVLARVGREVGTMLYKGGCGMVVKWVLTIVWEGVRACLS